MYCRNCGKEINDEAKFCKFCGIELTKNKEKIVEEKFQDDEKIPETTISIDKEYVFLNKLEISKRDKIRKILYYSKKIVALILGVITILHIKDEFVADENYKILVYVIRFINAVGPMALVHFVLDELYYCIELKMEKLLDKSKNTSVIFLELLYVLLGFLAWILILNPTDAEMLSIYGAVAMGGLFDYLMIIKVPLALLIISGLIKYYMDKTLIKEEIDKVV